MRHNDYPTTLLMEPAANDEPLRYRMTPAASTVRHEERRIRTVLTEAQLTAAYDYEHDCMMFERGDHAPSMQWVGVDVAGGPGAAAVVTYTRTGSTVRIDTVFTSTAPQIATTLPLASTESASGAALIGTKTEPEAEVWHKTARAGMRVTVAKKDGHGFPFMPSMKDLEGSSGTVEEIDNADGTAFVQMDGREKYWFDMHSLLPAAEADTPAPAAQESAKPEFAVGCRVVVLPHPDGGQHPSPFIALMSEDIGKSGTVKRITEAGNIDVSIDDRTAYIFPPSSLAIIQA